MKKFILSTDSCSDVFKSELKRDNIYFIPMAFIFEQVESRDNYDSDQEYKDFYDRVRAGALPKTAQLNPVETAEYFEKILQAEPEGDIIHISLSGGLSNTAVNAKTAAEEVMRKYPNRKIYAVDSLAATQGQRYILDRAKEFRDQGLSAEETVERLNAIIKRLHHFILAKDLFHLMRGGRVSGVKAVVGTILGIKPIIVINHEGRLIPIDKVKGGAKSLKYMIDAVKKHGDNVQRVYIAHADDLETAEELKQMLFEAGYPEVKIGYIGPVIGAHTGPGTVGLVFEGKKRMEVYQK